jgi:hypothetical protein
VTLRKIVPFTLSFAFLAVSAFGQQVVVYNSSGNTPDGADRVAIAEPLGGSFTNPSASTLVDVKITLANTDLSAGGGGADAKYKHPPMARLRPRAPALGSITVALYSSTAGNPPAPLSQIAVLGTLNDTSLTSSPTVYDFPVPNIPLAAGTRYWIRLSTSNSNIAYWAWGPDAGTGVTTEYFYNGTGAHPNSGEPFLMEVTVGPAVSLAPVPPSLMLVLIGLGGIGFYFAMRRFAPRVLTLGRQ